MARQTIALQDTADGVELFAVDPYNNGRKEAAILPDGRAVEYIAPMHADVLPTAEPVEPDFFDGHPNIEDELPQARRIDWVKFT